MYYILMKMLALLYWLATFHDGLQAIKEINTF